MLRVIYRLEGEDSHPNRAANEAIGPLFAEAVMAAARDYPVHRSSGPSHLAERNLPGRSAQPARAYLRSFPEVQRSFNSGAE